jgi:hypothetical protein
MMPLERPTYTMNLERVVARAGGLRRFRLAACVPFAASALLVVAPAMGAQRLPPTPPTSAGNPNSVSAPIAATTPAGNMQQHHRARVSYSGEMLEVRADNSSLNQILRDISQQTGMKIVGGVADQRVFGVYGPAPAATVLQTLLDGTGANVLLKERPDHAPLELVLSPRIGGVTPPGPSSPTYDLTETEPELPLPATARPTAAVSVPATGAATENVTAPASSTPPSMPQPANNVLGSPSNVSPTVSTLPSTNSVPLSSLPTPSSAPPVSGIVDSPNPPPAGSTTAGFTSQTPPDNNPNTAPPATSPATTPPTATQTTTQTSPNGVKTPQQIYQELLQMQQPKQKANPQGSSAPQ